LGPRISFTISSGNRSADDQFRKFDLEERVKKKCRQSKEKASAKATHPCLLSDDVIGLVCGACLFFGSFVRGIQVKGALTLFLLITAPIKSFLTLEHIFEAFCFFVEAFITLTSFVLL
jgi:hypothetical protein